MHLAVILLPSIVGEVLVITTDIVALVGIASSVEEGEEMHVIVSIVIMVLGPSCFKSLKIVSNAKIAASSTSDASHAKLDQAEVAILVHARGEHAKLTLGAIEGNIVTAVDVPMGCVVDCGGRILRCEFEKSVDLFPLSSSCTRYYRGGILGKNVFKGIL
jgi:hypothetical protein